MASQGNALDQSRRGPLWPRCFTAFLILAPLVIVGCLADDVDPGDTPGVTDPGDPGAFTIGGEVTGLDADPVTLALNEDAETLQVEENGDFAFDTELEDGADYAVTVESQPENRSCQVEDGTGTVAGADVEDIAVECTGAPELSSISEPMQFHLSWEGPDTVDLKYSSDPDCDWDNYSTCPDAEMLIDVSGGEETFEAIADEFDPDTGWYFVAESGGQRSNQVGARPGPLTAADEERGWGTHLTDDTLYVAGDFDHVGMPTGGGAMLNPDTADLTGSVPHVDGYIYDTTPDGEGGWYVAGAFNSIGDKDRQNLARIRADGSVDADWRANANDAVNAVAHMDDRLYVGGAFSEIEWAGGVFARDRLAALDVETGQPVEEWNPGADAVVYTLIAREELVYAGGDFSTVGEGDSSRENLAAFDPEDATVSTSWSPDVTTGQRVYVLLHAGDTVYVGGQFSEIDDEDADNLAALDAGGGGIDTDWAGDAGGPVGALAYTNGRLFVGGEFSEAGSNSDGRDNLAAFEADTGQLVNDWAPDPNDSVQDMVAHDGQLYINGAFTRFNDEDRLRDGLALVDADTGELDSDWAPGASYQGSGWLGAGTISASDEAVFVGNEFLAIGAHRTSLAAIDVNTGLVDREWQVELDSTVWDMVRHDDRLYLAGGFVEANETERRRLAAFSLDTGELDEDWDPDANHRADSLYIADDHLYVGGRFSEIDGEGISHLARLDIDSGDVESGWDPEMAGFSVFSVRSHNDTLYVAGNFDEVGGDTDITHLAALDIDTAEPDDEWPVAAERVLDIEIHNDTLYAGGAFSGDDSLGSERRDHLGAIDLDDGEVDSDWDPGADARPWTIELTDDDLLIGGDFSEIGGGSDGTPYDNERDRLAAVDLETGEVDADWDPGSNHRVRSILAHEDHVIVGGDFTEAGGGSGSDPDHKLRPGFISIDAETGELVW